MLQYYFPLHQFRLIKWSFFVQSTTRNAPYLLPRLDLILKFCWTFLIAHATSSKRNRTIKATKQQIITKVERVNFEKSLQTTTIANNSMKNCPACKS